LVDNQDNYKFKDVRSKSSPPSSEEEKFLTPEGSPRSDTGS